MIFKGFAERWLGSKSKLKIALYFLSGRGPAGEREISRAVGISNVAAGKTLEDMKSVNFLKMSKIGNTNVWSLNEKSFAFKCLKDLQTLAKDPPLLQLKKNLEADFEKCKNIKRLVLFGSIAEGSEKETSDIDIFIMVDREDSKKSILKKVEEVSEKYTEFYGNSLSAIVMAQKEFEDNKKLKENIDRGIIII